MGVVKIYLVTAEWNRIIWVRLIVEMNFRDLHINIFKLFPPKPYHWKLETTNASIIVNYDKLYFPHFKLGNNNKVYIDGMPYWTVLQDCVDDTDKVMSWNIGVSIFFIIIICPLLLYSRYG